MLYQIQDYSNIYALLKASEKLRYHIVNRFLKSPLVHFKSSLDQETFLTSPPIFYQFYPPDIKPAPRPKFLKSKFFVNVFQRPAV